jgi:alanine dehydrogenase
VERAVVGADLVIGALLIPGAKAKKVVTGDMIKRMRPGSVIVDVAIDQGGCVEGARPTSHDDPVYSVDGVTMYCVTNLPGCVARTSTFALTNATFPYVSLLAGRGYEEALRTDPALKKGLNVHKGDLVCQAVAEGTGLEYCPYGEDEQ